MTAAPPPPPAELARRFGTLVIHVTRAWRREADARLAPLGLSYALAAPLLLLRARRVEGCRQHELAGALGIGPSSLVRLLDQLCRAGLVERRGSPGDRRAKTLSLTPAGQLAARRAGALLAALRRDLLQAAAPQDLSAALRVLGGMRRALGTRQEMEEMPA